MFNLRYNKTLYDGQSMEFSRTGICAGHSWQLVWSDLVGNLRRYVVRY